MPTDPLAPSDPFSRDDILSMTHQPEAPNPVPGIVKPAIDFMTSGDMTPAHKPGTQPKDYLRELAQNPDIMAKNIEQASNFAGMAGTTKPPRYMVTSPEGKKYIIAYHGSPHDFDKFDSSKIGTGEGAQAYGSGLYFAENEGTARSYRDALSDLKKRQVVGTDYEIPSWVANKIASRNPIAINDVRTDFQGRLAEMKRQLADPSTPQPWNIEANIPGIENILKAIDHVEAGGQLAPAGRMYQVAIKADPEHFLDYDRPFNEQPQRIKEAIWKAGGGTKSHVSIQMDAVLRDLGDDVRHKLMTANADKFARKEMTQAEYNKANQALWNTRDDVLASDALRQAGIPGIKYLDQGSRDAGEGSRNYVVFDDKLIDILKKYGWAGLGLPALGAGGKGDKQ